VESKELIESGLLELHAAGALEGNDLLLVEQMIQTDAEVAAAYKNICESLEIYSSLHAVSPSDTLKEKILNEIFSNQKNIIPIQRGGSIAFWQYAAAAAVVLFVLSSFAAFYFAGKYYSAGEQLATAEKHFESLNNQMSLVLNDQKKLREEMDMINGMNTMKVKLNGTDQHPGMEVLVYYDLDSKHIMLDSGNLPALPDSLQYQLWAIAGSNVSDAGAFSSHYASSESSVERKIYFLKSATTAEMFAITIEKFGGSPTPHTDKMVAVGKIKI